MSIRLRLLLLLLFATLIPALVSGMQFLERREAETAAARQELAAMARQVARGLNDTVRATAQLHYGLSRARDLDTQDRAACSAFLADVLKEHPQYTGILTVKPDGGLFCDSLRTGRTLNLKDRRYFQDALNAGNPLAVEPVFGRLTGVAVLQVAYAARRATGELKFVQLASLNLEKIMQSRSQALPGQNMAIALVDGKGTVLTWHPDGDPLRGTSIADTPLFRFARDSRGEAVREDVESGGVSRIWAVSTLPEFPEAGLHVLVGVSKQALLAAANRTLVQALATLLAVSLLVFAGAWMLARGVMDRELAEGRRIRELNESLEERVRERTAQLRESEERLNFSLQTIHTGGWELDLLDHTAHRTPEHDRIFGYGSPLPQWTYEMFLEHVLPEDRAEVDRRFREATAALADWSFECRIRRADGEVRWIWATGEHQRDEAGQVRRMAGIVQDITGRKQAEQRLREQMQRAEGLLEAAPDPVVIVDREGRIAIVNARTEAVFGYARAELLGRPVELLIPQRLHAAHVAQRAPYQEHPRARAMGAGRDLHARRKDGSEFAADISLSPLATPEGTLIISTVRDVTERKQAERRIRGQLEHLNLLDHITRAIGERQDMRSIFQVVVRSLEDSLPVDFACVCLYDPAANALTVTCVGAKSEVLAHELTMDVKVTIGIDDNGLLRCVQGQLVYEPDIGQVRFPFPGRLARGGLGSLVLAPLKSESRVFGVLVAARRGVRAFGSTECEFLRQLSEHVALAANQAQLYGALREAYDDLRRTQQTMQQEERLRALGQMASGIAHDINNALSPVSLYAESMLETERGLSGRARGYLEIIQRAVEDVAQTVARMREFYRPREAQLALTPVQMNSMVRQVLDLTRARWSDQPLQSGVVIRALTELAHDLPKFMGVESEIREALTNLVFNAVDAMPAGGTLTLRTRVADAGADRAAVVVEVADTGVGMDEDTRRRCLEPFFTTKGERGTGLGLAMVFGTVQRHSAELEIESAPGAGTTVRLVFAVPATIPAEPGQPGQAFNVPSRLRLLLVDDDPILLRSLRDALETDGHVIETANGGEAGIAAFRAALDRGEAFAAVITDLGMPYVDGRRVAVAVKEASPATPVILLTGWGRRLVAEGDIPPHVDRVLAKPPKLRELRQALAQLCRPEPF